MISGAFPVLQSKQTGQHKNSANNKTTRPNILPVKGNSTSPVSSVQKKKTLSGFYTNSRSWSGKNIKKSRKRACCKTTRNMDKLKAVK